MLKIKKLTATNVHGYIPIKLNFKNDLTFLTGSNGCGKTTALKLISSILQPNFELLNQITFDSVKLTCWINDEEVVIYLEKSDDATPRINWSIQRKYRLKKSRETKETIEPSEGKFRLYPNRDFFEYTHEEYASLKETVTIDFVNSEYHRTIHSFSNPILLGIDRKITGNVYDYDKRASAKRRHRYFGGTNDVSFNDAQRVIMEYVSDQADVKKTLVENFKSDIFKSLFLYLDYKEESPFKSISVTELANKRKVTIQAIKNLEMGEEIVDEVKNYFDKIGELQHKVFTDRKKNNANEDNDLNEWWMNRPHIERIESVAEKAQVFQSKIDVLDNPLKEITRIVNSFFKEGNKRIRIGANGLIHVDWSDQGISTRNLSSGEIQLIVIIIHLVFCENRNDPTVFVIDEPELSLHISWQEKFVEAMLEASPRTQFILATHSPSIISKLDYEKNCVFLENV